jgi:hypothetical protein
MPGPGRDAATRGSSLDRSVDTDISSPCCPSSCLTTLAISGEAHRDGQDSDFDHTFVMCRGSQWSVVGFGRFIAGLV